MTSTSPLRYPGGKARFTDFICDSLKSSGKEAKIFVEPFCGGAGASIALLELGKVQRIALNDIDPLVSSFWKVVFGKTRASRKDIDWLIRKIESSEITVDEWRRQKAIKPDSYRSAAWKCLFLNRTSFNGIIHLAGPIGGWEQLNRTIDVRFKRERIVTRLNELYDIRDQIERVESLNWKKFTSYFKHKRGAFIYFDPPYYHKAEQLYGYVFNERGHLSMRDYIIKLKCPWMLSYDDVLEVRSLYSNLSRIQGRVIDQTYSAHPVGGNSFVGRELFFSNCALPMINLNQTKKLHVGMTVIGCFKEVAANV